MDLGTLRLFRRAFVGFIRRRIGFVRRNQSGQMGRVVGGRVPAPQKGMSQSGC